MPTHSITRVRMQHWFTTITPNLRKFGVLCRACLFKRCKSVLCHTKLGLQHTHGQGAFAHALIELLFEPSKSDGVLCGLARAGSLHLLALGLGGRA